MSDVTPLPGVMYSDTITPLDAFYVPRWEGDPRPWLFVLDDLNASREAELPDSFREVYNPHPQTRTEWAVMIAGGLVDDGEILSTYGQDEQRAREHARYSVHARHLKLGSRQVTETEWQEVDQWEKQSAP